MVELLEMPCQHCLRFNAKLVAVPVWSFSPAWNWVDACLCDCCLLHAIKCTTCTCLHAIKCTLCTYLLHAIKCTMCTYLHAFKCTMCTYLHAIQCTMCTYLLHAIECTLCTYLHAIKCTICTYLHAIKCTMCTYTARARYTYMVHTQCKDKTHDAHIFILLCTSAHHNTQACQSCWTS